MNASSKNLTIPIVIIIGMMLWALYPNNPYGYYVLLRWVSCPTLAYFAFVSHESKQDSWVWFFGISVLVFNPLIPLHLTREIWSVLNLVVIGALAAFAVSNKIFKN